MTYHLRPLVWTPLGYRVAEPTEWMATVFGGAMSYGIRRMKDGRYAITVADLHYDAKDSFEEAASFCETDRMLRLMRELSLFT